MSLDLRNVPQHDLMAVQSALGVTMPWGKHRGLTLADIVKDESSYITWLGTQELHGPNSAELKIAIPILLKYATELGIGGQKAKGRAPMLYMCSVCGAQVPSSKIAKVRENGEVKYYCHSCAQERKTKQNEPTHSKVKVQEDQFLYSQQETIPLINYAQIQSLVELMNNWTIHSVHPPELYIYPSATGNKVRLSMMCVLPMAAVDLFSKRVDKIIENVRSGENPELPISPVIPFNDSDDEVPF